MTRTVLNHHRADCLVAFGGAGERVAADLLRDAGTVAAALPASGSGSQVLMVFERDRYAFAAGLLAAWSQGHAILLAADGRPSTIRALLERSDVAALLHDTHAGGHLHVPTLLGGPAQPAVASCAPAAAFAATVFTAGTTADPKPARKTGAQLLDEVDLVAEALGWPLQSRIVSTLGPAHLYGLVLGVLLPLRRGGAFGREISPDIEHATTSVDTHAADTLVSVPAHLRCAPAMAGQRCGALRRVVSCTAPVDAGAVRAFADLEHVQVFDLFGTTQTGTIAWRDPIATDVFEVLPDVTVSCGEGGHLVIDSPRVGENAGAPYATDDRVTPVGEGFMLADRRPPAGDLVAWLRTRPGVDDAEVALLARPEGGTTALAIIAATADLDSRGRSAIHDRLGRAASSYEVVFVGQLPREPTGKLQRRILLGAFGRGADGNPRSRSLRIGELEPAVDADVVTVDVHVPHDYVYFVGHFEGYPIMAGVVQLHELILPLVRRARPDLGDLTQLGQLKFLGRITPGDDVRVTLRFFGDKSECVFEITRGDDCCSAGRLSFAAVAEAS